MAFQTVPDLPAVGHAVVLGCSRGPCWLWGTCRHRASSSIASPESPSGPLVAIIGSARSTEYDRTLIFRMCRQRPALCAVFDTGNRENSTTSVHSRIPDMYQLLVASTFCINPPGDTPTRKGIFDSLVVGCIPVLTSEDSMQHYQFHLPNWRALSVLITTDLLFSVDFNIADYLEAYVRDYPADVAQKQEAIRLQAYSLQYSVDDKAPPHRGKDAFDTTLEHLLSRPRSPPNQQDYPGIYAIVNVASGRRLFASAGDDYVTGFGASSSDSVGHQQWRILGKGDGSCCYSLVNFQSQRALYAQANASDWSKFGASLAKNMVWADQKWRFREEGGGHISIINVASGRRLFAQPKYEGSAGLGATLAPVFAESQRWGLVKVAQSARLLPQI